MAEAGLGGRLRKHRTAFVNADLTARRNFYSQSSPLRIIILDGTGHLHGRTFGAQYWNWLPFTRDVSAVTDACPTIRKAVFDRRGRFDERFPVNYSDADLCLRARKAGYDVVTELAATTNVNSVGLGFDSASARCGKSDGRKT
jgi:GT2 family glycosyltransferase